MCSRIIKFYRETSGRFILRMEEFIAREIHMNLKGLLISLQSHTKCVVSVLMLTPMSFFLIELN